MPPLSDWVDLDAREKFIRYAGSNTGVIVIVDTANGTKYHSPSAPCIDAEHYDQKVTEGAGRNGRYFWVPTPTRPVPVVRAPADIRQTRRPNGN